MAFARVKEGEKERECGRREEAPLDGAGKESYRKPVSFLRHYRIGNFGGVLILQLSSRAEKAGSFAVEAGKIFAK